MNQNKKAEFNKNVQLGHATEKVEIRKGIASQSAEFSANPGK